MKRAIDRLVSAISRKGNPCVVGLDPRIDEMPNFALPSSRTIVENIDHAIHDSILVYNKIIIDSIRDIVAAVKLQSAFYEQYGLAGLKALRDSVQYAKENDLTVILDAKRGDIDTTSQAYANAFLGETSVFGKKLTVLDADFITVSPYLGEDSLDPFFAVCSEYGKGIFVLVRTSNKGTKDLQDMTLADGRFVYEAVAGILRYRSTELMGETGYSGIGAVVSASDPQRTRVIRKLLPNSIFLVPGYGVQGATSTGISECFNGDEHGAIVSASRSLTYGFEKEIGIQEFRLELRTRLDKMANDVLSALSNKARAQDLS